VQYLRDLSHRAEFALVVTLAFGYFILGSLVAILSASADVGISEAGLQFTVAFELSSFAVLGTVLFIRGWDRQQLGLVPNRTDLWMAIALGIVAYAAFLAVWVTLGQAVPGAAAIPEGTIKHDLSIATLLIASLVNAIFEEVFVCGYVISALRKTRSLSFAINVSIAIRLSYHLYQGPAGVVSIVPVGLVFAHWFARTGRLWPVAIAHCLFDIFALWPYLAGD
jgi:membrane protease YdiL (CAAX protease family)